jgi:hypothetical protein
MRKDRAEREAAEQNKNEATTAYVAFHAGRNRWQVRRREADLSYTLISQ